MSKQEHLLIIRLSAMGDVAMTVPVIRQVVKQYPSLKLTVLTRPFFAPFFRGLPNVEVFPIDVNGTHKGASGLFKLSRILKKQYITAVADLHNVLRSKMLKVFFLGTPFVQVNKARAEKKALINGQSLVPLKPMHLRYAEVFKALGYEIDLLEPDFPVRQVLPDFISRLLTNSTKPLVGIAPFAQYSSKMYPLDKMELVIKQLSESYEVLLFGGGAKEVEVLEAIASKNTNVYSLAGKMSLDEELDVISNLDVMLSMDSGNGHIAAMLGIKVITVWGVTQPSAGFVPFNQPESHQLLPNKEQYPLLPTSIYGNKFPEGYEAVAGSIPVETVVEKVKTIVG